MQRLVVDNLTVRAGPEGPALLHDVSFTLGHGERRALVGRSGAGKSLIAATILRLLPSPLIVVGGSVSLNGIDLLRLDRRSMREHRGRGVFWLFQSTGSALNPCMDVQTHVRRAAARQGSGTDRTAATAIDAVGLSAAARKYPFELSGGMRQRVLIAMAMVLEPQVLIADEPTTGLDPITQNEVLSGLNTLLQRTGASLLFITHDMRAAGVLCSDAIVLDRGAVAAAGPWRTLVDGGAAARALVDAARGVER
jgi:ABC-type glutathione transport system ATPase component